MKVGRRACPIFGRSPSPGPHALFTITVPQRSPSDITNWRRSGLVETPAPIIHEVKPAKVTLVEVAASTSASSPSNPATAASPHYESFYLRAKELLSSAEFEVLEDLAKGEPADA